MWLEGCISVSVRGACVLFLRFVFAFSEEFSFVLLIGYRTPRNAKEGEHDRNAKRKKRAGRFCIFFEEIPLNAQVRFVDIYICLSFLLIADIVGLHMPYFCQSIFPNSLKSITKTQNNALPCALAFCFCICTNKKRKNKTQKQNASPARTRY